MPISSSFPSSSSPATRPRTCCSAPASFAPRGERSTRSRKAAHGITVLVGAPHLDADLYNACFVLAHGEVRGVYRKRYLPNYGVFDEDRYFAPGDDLCPAALRRRARRPDDLRGHLAARARRRPISRSPARS